MGTREMLVVSKNFSEAMKIKAGLAPTMVDDGALRACPVLQGVALLWTFKFTYVNFFHSPLDLTPTPGPFLRDPSQSLCLLFPETPSSHQILTFLTTSGVGVKDE